MIKDVEFRETLERYSNLVYGTAWYATGNEADAADITQDVFIKYWIHIDQVSAPAIKSWLLKVTRNRCIDFYRKKREFLYPNGNGDSTNVVSVVADHRPGPEQQTEQYDRWNRLLTAIRKLPIRMRLIIILREIHQLSYEEISNCLDIPLGSVKVTLHRSRKKLFELIRQTRKEVKR